MKYFEFGKIQDLITLLNHVEKHGTTAQNIGEYFEFQKGKSQKDKEI